MPEIQLTQGSSLSRSGRRPCGRADPRPARQQQRLGSKVLGRRIENARVERIENARTFVQLDAPERLATLVAEFATAPESVYADRS